MRTIVNWWLQVVCRHEWKTEERRFLYVRGGGETTRVSATCHKCGWHRVYEKWGA